MASLELRLLGGCEAVPATGEALRLPTRKGWVLLAYLALHPGREVARERLATLLWGDRFDEQARASLRETLYELRGALREQHADLLVAQRDSVALRSEGLEVDALRLEHLARHETTEDLAEVGALYRGPLLDGLGTVAPDFDEWLAAERARLQELACEALQRLVRLRLERGESAAAVETAQQLVRIDPLRDRAHRLLMQSLAADGRRSEALRHFQDLERLLEAELGVAPDAETMRLRAGLIEGGRPGPSPDPVAADGPGPVPADAASGAAASGSGRWRLATVALVFFVAIGLAGASVLWLRAPGPLGEASSAGKIQPRNTTSLAVLPFENISDDQPLEYFAAGLTEDLTTALSKGPQLLVAARTSTAAHKDRPGKVQDIARDLGVSYVLEGSVQKRGDKLRIAAQLIDASGGHHLWSGRFDRDAEQIFALQDDIVRRVLVELQVELTEGDHAHLAGRGTTDLEAWLLRLQAMSELYKFTRESTARTRELFQAAHERDPKWDRPLAGLAWSYWWEAKMGWAQDREEWIRRGTELAEQAIALEPEGTVGYMQLGNLAQLQGDHVRAVALREKAVEIAPNDFQANWGLGYVLVHAGEDERGVEVLKHAMKLAPRPPPSLFQALGFAQLVAGHYQDAIGTATRASAFAPDDSLPHLELAAAHSALGHEEDAARAAADLMRVEPGFRISKWLRTVADFKDQVTGDRLAELLKNAGLPE